MTEQLFAYKATKRYFDFPEKKFSLAQIKRQRTITNSPLNWFTPKRYPSIFFDQRLESRFSK